MGIMMPRHMMPDNVGPTTGTPEVRVAVFSERVSELQDLSEMATAIRLVAKSVEKGLLGNSAPVMDDSTAITDGAVYGPGTDRKASDTNLAAEIRTFTSITRDNLQVISDVLNAIGRELGDIGGVPGAILQEIDPPRTTESLGPHRG